MTVSVKLSLKSTQLTQSHAEIREELSPWRIYRSRANGSAEVSLSDFLECRGGRWFYRRQDVSHGWSQFLVREGGHMDVL